MCALQRWHQDRAKGGYRYLVGLHGVYLTDLLDSCLRYVSVLHYKSQYQDFKSPASLGLANKISLACDLMCMIGYKCFLGYRSKKDQAAGSEMKVESKQVTFVSSKSHNLITVSRLRRDSYAPYS